MMTDDQFFQILEEKTRWLDDLYFAIRNLEAYKWLKAPNIRHKCSGEIYVYIETTGIGYVCDKCQEAELL